MFSYVFWEVDISSLTLSAARLASKTESPIILLFCTLVSLGGNGNNNPRAFFDKSQQVQQEDLISSIILHWSLG